jgi:hypothetical protein
MTSTITIPAPLVEHVHDATLYHLGKAGDEIMGQAELSKPELGEPLRRFDTMRALVDATSADYGSDIEVKTSPDALLAALRDWAQATGHIVATASEEGEDKLAEKYAGQLAAVTEFMVTVGGDT